jgi:hypothetical protein
LQANAIAFERRRGQPDPRLPGMFLRPTSRVRRKRRHARWLHAVNRERELGGQTGIELAGLVIDRHLLLVLGGGDLGELEIVAHGTISTVRAPGKPRPTCALIW